MEILLAVAAVAILVLLVYIAAKIREAIIRLTIIDARLRVMEPLLSNPAVNDSNYSSIRQALYEKTFSEFYIGTYDRIVRLARKEIELRLSWLKSTEEIKREAAKKVK